MVEALMGCLASVLSLQLMESCCEKKNCLAIVCEMEACSEYSLVKFKQHIMINFLSMEGVSPSTKIHQQMQILYGDSCIDVSTMYCWVKNIYT